MNRITEMRNFIAELYYVKNELFEAIKESLTFKFFIDDYQDEIREKAIEIIKEQKEIDNTEFFTEDDWELVENEEYLLLERNSESYIKDHNYDVHEFLSIYFNVNRIERVLKSIKESKEKLKSVEINTFLIETDLRDLIDYIEKLRLKLRLVEIDHDSKEIEEFNNFITSDYVSYFKIDFDSGMVLIRYNYNELEKIFRSLENYSHRIVYDLENN